MSKKTPETPQRKPRATPRRAKPKAAPAARPVTATTAATEGKVEAVLAVPKFTPEQIVDQIRSGKIDSSFWAGQGYTVEIVGGQIFISKKVGCVTRKIVLPVTTEPAAVPAAPNPATTADTTATEAPADTTEQPALAPVASAPDPAQPNGNEGNGRKLPPPPPPRRKTTPPLGTLVTPAAAIAGEPTVPKVVVPAMEAQTIVIPVVQEELIRNSNTPNEVTIFIDGTERLARKVKRLIEQADLLLRNGELPSGADTATIINNFEDYEQQAAALERFHLSTQLSPDQRKLAVVEQTIATVHELNGKIKEKLLALRAKQAENGETKKQMDVIEGRKTVTRIALESVGVIAVIAAGTILVTQRNCGDSTEQPHTTTSVVAPDTDQRNLAPLPPEMPEQTAPPAETPAAPTQPEPPAKPTATFNCEIDTIEEAKIRCVDPNLPDADIQEKLDWTGIYNAQTQTVPAEVTLTTPDGKQFTAQFDAQIGTRQELSWTLEAVVQ